MNHDNTSDNSSDLPQPLLPKRPWYQRRRLILPLLIAAPVIAAGLWFGNVFSTSSISGQDALVELSSPDAWIHSQNLSQLPRDLLTVPLIKDVLTEDFLYFYDTDEDWLSLKGSIRRISFEHELNWQDNLVQSIAQSPADIYLWRDSSSALRYWAIAFERKGLTAVAQQLAQIKLNADKQLSQIGSVKVDGDEVPVLQMKLSPRRNMVLAVHGERLALVSDAAMLNDGRGKLSDAAGQLLEKMLDDDVDERQKIAKDLLSPNEEKVAQSIALSQRFFAQGYGALMPHVRGLRFYYDGSAWHSQVHLAEGTSAPNIQIWQHIPSNAAWCVSTTIDWSQVQKNLDAADTLNEKPDLSKVFNPTGAACWYEGESNSVTKPLLIGQLNEASDKNTDIAKTMSDLFNWTVSTNKTYLADVRKAANALRKATNQLSALKSEQKKLEKEADAFNRKSWEARRKTLKADIAASKKRMEQEEDNASPELLPQIKERNQEFLTLYQDELKTLESEPDEYKKRFEESLTKNKTQQDETSELISKLTDTLKTEQTRARDNSAPSFALNVKSQNGMTIISRKMPISKITNPAMAFTSGGVVYFSLDAALVQRGVAVFAKTYPNLYEAAPSMQVAGQIPYFYLNPTKFAALFMQEGHKALPMKSKGKLRTAFDFHMTSRMTALASHAEMSATVDSASKTGWQSLNWQK
ncbi:DUF2138 family protein [Hydromonas duriensis]|nr:DUF2138 family protein [Hydromonas duriensis]